MDIKIPRFEPIYTEDNDIYGFKNGAKRLKKILNNIDTPNAIGIYGIWGSGKTSLMQLTKNIIDIEEDSKIITIWFDAWKYEYEESVPIVYPLLFQIQNIIQDKDLNTFLKEKGKQLGTIGLSLLRSITNTSITDLNSDFDTATNIMYSKYEKWIQNIDDFRSEFQQKLGHALTSRKKEKVYIFIDDMDRCLPENSILLLEMMKNYLNVENTLFIIGVDKRVIVDHINHKYGMETKYGDEYLTKIIPLSLNLPNQDAFQIIKHTLTNVNQISLFEDNELEEIDYYLSTFCANNKRQILTLFYKYLLILSIIDIEKLYQELFSKNTIDTLSTAKIAVLRWILVQELESKIFNDPQWDEKFDNIAFGKNKNNTIYRICSERYKDSIRDALAPHLDSRKVIILYKYINEGLFF